jgi:hypothetical protein
MAQDRFLIAPITEGQESDLKPFLIPDQAFTSINNAYVFRGRIRKRFGSRVLNTTVAPTVQQLYTRLRIALVNTGTGLAVLTDGFGDANDILPGAGAAGAVGQMFSIGDQIFTIISGAAGVQNMLLTGGVTAQFNITTGNYIFDGCTPLTQIYWYPALPVMGFITYETGDVNNNSVFAFDTRFSYVYTGGWERFGSPTTWTGTDSQFFWGTNWQGDQSYNNLLFVVNYNQPDQIKYWNSVTAVWTTIHPRTSAIATDTLETARLLLTFKDRIIALNTIEHEGADPAGTYRTHCNRARWCQNGSPVDENGTGAIVAWRTDIPGRGGWIDAPTRQAIITAQILRDRLIVYFESSTWELVYTGNEMLPFRWQQINTELGAESTFSQIPFDKVILGIGNVGIHACNGAQVERIDEKIPNEVFQIHANTDGVRRIAGIRDFYSEMVYWTIVHPSYLQLNTYKFPNRILVYNYKTATWSYNDDCITAFGYYEQQDARSWVNMQQTWSETTDTWSSGQLSTNPRQIIAGNQEGFTFVVDVDNPRNSLALSITDITVVANTIRVIDHNLKNSDFILIENCQGITILNGRIFQVRVIDKDTFTLLTAPLPAGPLYTGGGTISYVSKIDILTKQYNFYLKENRNAFVNKVDFLVDNEPQGRMFVECYPSYSNIPLVESSIAGANNLGTSVLELSPYVDNAGNIINPVETAQTQFWHPLYFQVEGESVQLRISQNDIQMLDPVTALRDFTLNAFTIYAMPTASRLQ